MEMQIKLIREDDMFNFSEELDNNDWVASVRLQYANAP